MQRIRSDEVSTDERTAPASIISGPVLPVLRRRRTPEHAARIATKRRALELVQMLEARGGELGISPPGRQ